MSTDYTNAPATAMLATRCAACRRELVDSASVNTGMGPDCRKRHGYDAAPGPANVGIVVCSLEDAIKAGAKFPNDLPRKVNGSDWRTVANVCVHALAVLGPRHDASKHLVAAVEACGFATLGKVLRKRLPIWSRQIVAQAPVVRVVATAQGRYDVSSANLSPIAFNEFLGAVRGSGGRWDQTRKVWMVDLGRRRELSHRLAQVGDDVRLVTPQGDRTVGEWKAYYAAQKTVTV